MRVLHFPRDRDPYGDFLNSALAKHGVESSYLELTNRSATLNILGLPFRSLFFRGSVDVVHIHWTFPFRLSWVRSVWARRALRLWFTLWLISLRLARVKIVWTAHNFLPHNPVFDNDLLARQTLVRFASAVIAFDDFTARRISQEFGETNIYVVPPAIEPLSTIDYLTARNHLGIEEGQFVAAVLGTVAPYKGVGASLRVVQRWAQMNPKEAPRVKVVIAGLPTSTEVRAEVMEIAYSLQGTGITVELKLERISDELMAMYYSAADVAFFLFRAVTNSSSLLCAMAAGTPVIVSQHPSLHYLKSASYFEVSDESQAREAFEQIFALPPEGKSLSRLAALKWAEPKNWDSVGSHVKELYLSIL